MPSVVPKASYSSGEYPVLRAMDASFTVGSSDSQTFGRHWQQDLFTVDPEKVLPFWGILPLKSEQKVLLPFLGEQLFGIP